jgi:putative transposase
MARHTTFRFCLDPTVEQREVLARHAGASRVAFNQCLRMVKTALTHRRTAGNGEVPWTGFDLINTFNAWKKTEAAGRVFTVNSQGTVDTVITGLQWRREVCQQVFEEAAVDLGRGLMAWSDSRCGKRAGTRVGSHGSRRRPATSRRFGCATSTPRANPPPSGSVTTTGSDRSRCPASDRSPCTTTPAGCARMLAKDRATICFATISCRGGRWWIALNVQAAELYPDQQHPTRPHDDGGWVGVDRGLAAFVVAADADGAEVARIDDAPKALATGLKRQRRLSKALSRKKKGSHNRKDAAARLGRHHHHVANVRRHFLHRVSGELAKTHDRIVIENLNVAGMLANHRLARAISDAGWSEFARMLTYKQGWRGGRLLEADRWYPSTRLCPRCGAVNKAMTLADRVFTCGCGHSADRDTNAATNLARWAQHDPHRSPDPQAGGRATNVRRRDGAGQHPRVGETSPDDAGTDAHTAPAA